MRLSSCLLALLVCAGCGDDIASKSDAAVGADMPAGVVGPDLGLLSRCGHPGDSGNSLGVGKFCTNQGGDCGGNGQATQCSALLNGQTPSASDSYFCSFTCTAADPPGICGENASCLCATLGCACVPSRCITTDAGT